MKKLYGLLIAIGLLLLWSSIHPKDYFTWVLEVLPPVIGIAILIIIFPKFRFTNLVYFLVFVQAAVMIIGGHYTYAEVPLFDWVRDTFHQTRNNYDKIGHFLQGFVPAMIIREVFIRKNIVTQKGWQNVLVVAMCMAISVTYEFIEWFVALLLNGSADDFLGTQGYIWDTQSDMFYATVGAILALVFLSQYHNRSLKKLQPKSI